MRKIILCLSFAVLLALLASSMASATVMAPSASGGGWFYSKGYRNNFGFAVNHGNHNPVDKWNYGPNGSLEYIGRDYMGGTGIVKVRSHHVWRFQIRPPVPNEKKAVLEGVAYVDRGMGWEKGWWFHAVVYDRGEPGNMDELHISLWEPTGHTQPGGWSPGLFDPTNPSTLMLNPKAYYHSAGMLMGGNIQISP